MSEHDPYDGKTREEYLRELAEEFGAPYETVKTLADLLGPSEDFDGLVVELEDHFL